MTASRAWQPRADARARASHDRPSHEPAPRLRASQRLALQRTPRGRTCTCGGAGGQCEECRRKALQRQPATGATPTDALEAQADAASAAATAGAPVGPLSPAAPAATPETRGLLVGDGVAAGPGQMGREEFLALLQDRIRTAAVEVLGLETVEQCSEIDYWFGHYGMLEVGRIERAIARYAPEAADARSAVDYVEPIVARIRRAALVWATTGRLVGVPADAPEGVGPTPELATPLLKRREGASSADDPEGVRAQLLPGIPLESGVRTRMEAAFGQSFAGVRVHADSDSATVAQRLDARAFTVGDDIAFGEGEYRPGSLHGDALIAHELAHTIQQSGGGAAGPARAEHEANTAAAGALAVGRAGSIAARSGLAIQRCRCNPEQEPAPPAPTPSPTPTPAPPPDAGPPQQTPLPAPPTTDCDRTIASGDVVADHRVVPSTIAAPGDSVTITVTFRCRIRGDGTSRLVDSGGASLNLNQNVGRGSGVFTRSWDGKKQFVSVGTYMVDDGTYFHQLENVVYAYGRPARRGGPSPPLTATGSNLKSPPITVRTRGAVAAAPAGVTPVSPASHYSQANVDELARIVKSEMGIGNAAEQTAIAWAVRNQMVRLNTRDVVAARDHFGDAHNQAPTPAETAIAESVLRQSMSGDPTSGAIKWFSPRSMPSAPTPGIDCSGGVVNFTDETGATQARCTPGFHTSMTNVPVTGVRDWFLRLYRL